MNWHDWPMALASGLGGALRHHPLVGRWFIAIASAAVLAKLLFKRQDPAEFERPVLSRIQSAGLKVSYGGRQASRKDVQFLYKKHPIMSPNEACFFAQLRLAFPDLYIYPQVGMEGIVTPAYGDKDSRFRPARNKVSQKRIDFVLCAQDGVSVICIIELDDRSHDERVEQDRERDGITASAGYKTVRIKAAMNYEHSGIRQVISQALGQRAVGSAGGRRWRA